MVDKTILVTGASRGLGAAAARLAASMGANVALAARTQEWVEEEAEKIRAAGGKALALRGDVSREDDCRALVQRTLDQFGRIDGLVNNAGAIEPISPVAAARLDEWEQNWRVNLLGPVVLVQAALPHLRESQGRVVNITSGAAVNVIPGWAAYSTAKVGLNHLTRILAQEEPGVTTLALRPGLVDTEMQKTIRERGRSQMAERNYNLLFSRYDQGQLLPPEKPGLSVACLALYAPREWSGEVLSWDEERVLQLVQMHGS